MGSMIEIQWGKPVNLVVTQNGDIQKFSTIEQAHYWLLKKWPIRDAARSSALQQIDDAMTCMGGVTSARRAFIAAAQSAGFGLDTALN